ncbi:uncharacterized protein LOC122509810 [Leptopilina heterotoma]|uniref:uncharacterized protein LOC122509810 n=1 Tax=Leptopilina heterotoma TaxID=63436 RepID=UPI001CA7CECE|nr:uncharacterized protein LOC122509810 [Leptopilina heterotoma]
MKTETVRHIKKCFGYAVHQNKGKAKELADTLRSIPDHLFNRHEKCGSWCKRDLKPQKIILQDSKLYKVLENIFIKYANNASKFSVAASSQGNESFHNIVAHKSPKNHSYSLSESCSYRVASAVATKNEGDSHLLNVKEKLSLSPGKHTSAFVTKKDEVRKKRAIKAKLPATKRRRISLHASTESSRKRNERQEGIQYQPNCGLEVDFERPHIVLDPLIVKNKLQNNPISVEHCNLVYFDLETSGLSKQSDILQIAAKCGEKSFETYINPTQPVTPEAFKITGLENINGDLFLYGKPLTSIPLKQALIKFQQFLTELNPCVLVAHNAKFDVSHFLQAVTTSSMIENFDGIVGFSDSLTLFKKAFRIEKV